MLPLVRVAQRPCSWEDLGSAACIGGWTSRQRGRISAASIAPEPQARARGFARNRSAEHLSFAGVTRVSLKFRMAS